MAPIYDVRVSESSGDDDSYEVLDYVSDLFNEDKALPEESTEACGSSDHVPSRAAKASNQDAGDDTEFVACPNDETLEHNVDHNAHSVDCEEGNMLKKMEGLVESSINCELLHKTIDTVDAPSTTNASAARSRISIVVGGKQRARFPQSWKRRSKSQKLSTKGDVARHMVSNLTLQEPKTTRNNLETIGKFCSENGEEHVELHVDKPTKILQLGFSARLVYAGMELVIHNEGCLMVTDDNLVTKVSLCQPKMLKDTENFRQAAAVLLNQVRITQVLLDEVIVSRDKHRELFVLKLKDMTKQLTIDEEQVNTRIQILQFVNRSKQRRSVTYIDLCQAVKNAKFLCKPLQEQARTLEIAEQEASRRVQLFRRFGYHPKDPNPDVSVLLENLLMQMVQNRKDRLVSKAPAYLHESLNTIKPNNLVLIRENDVKLFTDMSSVLRADIFEKPLQDLAKRWVNRVKSIKVDGLNEPLRLTNVIVFYLCKSLEEVIVEISERTEHLATDLLKSTILGWYPIEKIAWKSKNAMAMCLQREYYFIFHLLMHFEKVCNFGRHPFQYTIKLFNSGNQSSYRRLLSGVKDAIVRTGRVLGYGRSEANSMGVPDEFFVWYCLLDDVLFHVLPNGCNIDMFNKVLEEYVQMIRDAKFNQMETLRIVTHNLARYIAQSYSYGGRKQLNAALDKAVLRKQLDIFSFRTKQNMDSLKNFRDQVDEFNKFWKTRNDIIDQFPTKINLPVMHILQKHLMEVMLIVLEKDVEVETRVAFFRTYNDFLIDLNEVAFDWYIKEIPEVKMESVIDLGKVELVDNKWKNTNNRTYRVLDPQNFAAFISSLTEKSAVPKHYIIEIIEALIDNIASQLQRTSWTTSEEHLSDTDQVMSSNELICTIRNSLLYLKEQIDYVSFQLFYDERVKPFASVLNGTRSRQDFSTRIGLIQESFWYIRKQNEISLEDALQLYNELNTSHDSQLLRESYTKYSQFFEEFMQLSADKELSERASLIAKNVIAQISDPVQFKKWDVRFKQDQVPKILAGMAAVWSILVSKDVANVGKYFNPHCIQILCILRLLSVDKTSQGIDKHLAQVLTGQGKSLVLGLLATIFTLTGHRVRIACYSEYLAKRDKQDFRSFFKLFNVAQNVTYGTFKNMANEIIAPSVDGQKVGLRDMVSELLFKEKAILPHKLVTADSSNDVLLIDEVDVFFTEKFYGNSFNPCCARVIPGLDQIQELIWKYVVGGRKDIQYHIHQFIRSDDFKQRGQFLEFHKRPYKYILITIDGAQTTYTNKKLFDEHLGMMVEDATHAIHNNDASKYKLSSAGVITYNYDGIYKEHVCMRYRNIFNYFRLKQTNFVPMVNGTSNYGYLNISCGSLSYAMFPNNYPLILGVSGTLTSLNQYENATIAQLYNIKQTSVMPTFFGCSNLQFDKIVNFHHHVTENSWRAMIFSHANQKIAANRAVIVFFDTDVELNAFRTEYAGQLDRVNELTENTEDNERCINEAGVAKTITLATRGMGRGVDYKSSVTVEKNGGLHVIQTFFSMDIKEETQIKGRTARKDNKGSYELIVCDQHLKWCDSLDSVTYAKLDAARGKVALDGNAKLSTEISRHKDAHHKTMSYMQSFFKN